MTKINAGSNVPALTSTSQPVTAKKTEDNHDKLATYLHADNDKVKAYGSYDLGDGNKLNAYVESDGQGLRRAHAEFEHFTDGGGRISAKVGTSMLSDETKDGAVMAKLQYDSGKMDLVGPLTHSVTVKGGAFHIPRTYTRRHDIDESMDLVGIGGKYELQLDTALGPHDDVKIKGRYGVSGGLFIEPNPTAESRETFTRGSNFSYFDIGKTVGFSELTASANTRAEYKINDHSKIGLTHNLKFEMDDITIGRTIDDHSVSADLEVISLFGRGKVDAKASVRVPIEKRTPRVGEAPDGVTSRVDVNYHPDKKLEINAYAKMREADFDGAGFSANYKIDDHWSVGARYDYNKPADHHRASIGFSFNFGAGGDHNSAPTDLKRSHTARNIRNPPASHHVYASQIADFPDVKNMSYDKAMKAIDTPEKAAALLGNNTYFKYGFHDMVKMSPRYSWEHPEGTVCAEQHAVQAQALRHHGYEVHNVQFFGDDVAHVITAYKDKKTGKWNLMDYNQIYETQADNIKEAMEKYEPGNYEYKVIDYSDTKDKIERPKVVGVNRSTLVKEVNQFWDDKDMF